MELLGILTPESPVHYLSRIPQKRFAMKQYIEQHICVKEYTFHREYFSL